MPATLPYLSTPGSLKTALDRIKSAATPDRFTGDFVSTKLQMKGGAGRAIIPFMKKIGFVGPDGAPTDIYKRFRNNSTSQHAAADAIKYGYGELAKINEYFYELNDKDLFALIIKVTGAASNSSVAKLTQSTLRLLKSYARFDADEGEQEVAPAPHVERVDRRLALDRVATNEKTSNIGLNLSYTINLNLPATSDQAVFNAIFRSLREHLLSGGDG